MIAQPPLRLLIDGNNLAHFLYTNLSPGQKMTPVDSQRLIRHLAAYARTNAKTVEVELCLDRSPGEWGPLPGNLHLFWAEYPQNGDDLLLGRLWFHHLGRRPCVVITNDETILEEVTETSAAALRVYDFMRRPGLNSPVFRSPEDLPLSAEPAVGQRAQPAHAPSLSTSIYFRIIAEDSERTETAPRRPVLPSPKTPKSAIQMEPKGEPAAVSPPPVVEEALSIDLPILDSLVESAEQPDENGESPVYFLNLDHWPIEEGVRFLLNAFCPAHRDKYRDLMSSFTIDTLRPADLRALAELLLHACGDEPDFARHGALMARVRLALLQARGQPLSLQDLAARTGFRIAGLRGRIRHKAHPWVIIV